MNRRDKALQFRAAAKLSAQTATDAQAITMPTMYSYWEKDTKYGGEGEPSIVRRNIDGRDQLYRCNSPHTSQKIYPPEIVPSLWTAINKTNAGTKDDPILAIRGMEYVEGLYYFDEEDGKLYLCTRSGTLHYMPHELVGQYFEEVSS